MNIEMATRYFSLTSQIYSLGNWKRLTRKNLCTKKKNEELAVEKHKLHICMDMDYPYFFFFILWSSVHQPILHNQPTCKDSFSEIGEKENKNEVKKNLEEFSHQ